MFLPMSPTIFSIQSFVISNPALIDVIFQEVTSFWMGSNHPKRIETPVSISNELNQFCGMNQFFFIYSNQIIFLLKKILN